MGIKILFELLATKFNFVKWIDFSYNDGTINSSLPEVASLTFTYIETIGFAEVVSLITSSSCKTRGEVRVSIHKKKKNLKVFEGVTIFFARQVISNSHWRKTRTMYRHLSATWYRYREAAFIWCTALKAPRYRYRHLVKQRPERTHLDTRIDSSFHVLQW